VILAQPYLFGCRLQDSVAIPDTQLARPTGLNRRRDKVLAVTAPRDAGDAIVQRDFCVGRRFVTRSFARLPLKLCFFLAPANVDGSSYSKLVRLNRSFRQHVKVTRQNEKGPSAVDNGEKLLVRCPCCRSDADVNTSDALYLSIRAEMLQQDVTAAKHEAHGVVELEVLHVHTQRRLVCRVHLQCRSRGHLRVVASESSGSEVLHLSWPVVVEAGQMLAWQAH
jgi:hypothetical protein